MDKEQHRAHTGRDIEYQQKEWTAQRIGWAVMALLVLMALAGLLGNNGPLADAELTAEDGSLAIGYLRFDRHHAPGELTVEVAPEFAQEGEVRLWLDRDYANSLEVQRVVPEPDSVVLEAERVVYVFMVGEQGGPLTIAFFYEHDGYWRENGRLGLVNGESVELSQFVFP